MLGHHAAKSPPILRARTRVRPYPDVPLAHPRDAVSDVLRVLEPIWTTKTETASRLRGRIEAVLSWATVGGHRTGDNPARWRGNLDAVLPKPGKVAKVKHNPAVSLADAADWFKALRERDGIATRALEFLALTAARSGEVRGATWDEIDMAAGLAEIALAHTVGSTVERAYRRSDMIEKRRHMMANWAQFLKGGPPAGRE